MNRVVLVDPGDGLETVRDALREHPDVTVDLADTLPHGPDVVGVLVPPDVSVGASALAALPDLRVVAATATGYDHLDLAAISASGAWATHCPGYCTEEVAEHAIAFALDLLRGVTLLDRSVHAGAWDLHQAAPRRVSGAVLGIVGLGRIGREVAGERKRSRCACSGSTRWSRPLRPTESSYTSSTTYWLAPTS